MNVDPITGVKRAMNDSPETIRAMLSMEERITQAVTSSVGEVKQQLMQQQAETKRQFQQINSNLNELYKGHVQLQRHHDVLCGKVESVRQAVSDMQQPGTVLHTARSNIFRVFGVPKKTAAPTGPDGSGSSRMLPQWQQALHGAKHVEDAVRVHIESAYPHIPIPPKLFSNAISWQYGKHTGDSTKQSQQMVVLTLTDSSLRSALFAVSKQLKEVHGLTFTVEWTLEEKQARRQIEASPAFQRAMKKANAEGKKAVWDFGTCTCGRRMADSTIWDLAHIAKLGEEQQQLRAA